MITFIFLLSMFAGAVLLVWYWDRKAQREMKAYRDRYPQPGKVRKYSSEVERLLDMDK